MLSCQNCFASKIVCEQCGGFYGSKVWGSNTKYRKIIWRCNNKYKGKECRPVYKNKEYEDKEYKGKEYEDKEHKDKEKCKTPHITEEEIKNKFLSVFNDFLGEKEEIIENCRFLQNTVCDQSKLDDEISELNREIEMVSELSKRIIIENARTAIDQEEFDEKYESYLVRNNKATEKLIELEDLKNEAQNKFRIFNNFIEAIKSREQTIEDFDEHLWNTIVEKVTVMRNGRLVFKFKDSSEITG